MTEINYEVKAKTFCTKIYRMAWGVTHTLLIGWRPRRVGMGGTKMIYRLFGAKISKEAYLYNSAKVYDPRNLILEGGCELGPNTEIYNVNVVKLEDGARLSQNSYICTAGHDISVITPLMPLTSAPITIKKNAWVAASAFVGPGVTIGEGAVVGARGVVFKDVEPWTVVGGNPAKVLKKRMVVEKKTSKNA